MSNSFEIVNITDLNQITKTGWYSGGNITQINQYILGGWNIINATVQSDKSARISVFNKRGLVLEINRDGSSSYTYFPLALKSDFMCGESIIPMNAGAANVTFPQAFENIPVVVAVARGSSKSVMLVTKMENISKSGFMVTAVTLENGSPATPSYDVTVEWIAMRKA